MVVRNGQPPAVLPVNADTIPDPLIVRPQWVGWRWEWSLERSEWAKVPVNLRTGVRARPNNPATWSSFEESLAVYLRSDSDLDGIGYMFSRHDPFTGVDCDKCRDPQTGGLVNGAQHLVYALSSYTEWSPRGEGIHIIVEADKPGDRCVGRAGGLKIEMYSHSRFFAFTGYRVPGTLATIEARQKGLADVYSTVLSERAPVEPRPAPKEPQSAGDALERAFRSKSGDKIKRLWNGDISDYRFDGESGHHCADLALCRHLVYWTNRNAVQVDRLFRQSGLYRPKWDVVHYSDGRTYGQATIDKAMTS